MTECKYDKIGTGECTRCAGCVEGVLESLHRDLTGYVPGSEIYNFAVSTIVKLENSLDNCAEEA